MGKTHNNNKSPKFVLEKFYENNDGSINSGLILKDGRLLVNGGYTLTIYNISGINFGKKELELFPGYIVSYHQLNSENIVVSNYQGIITFYSIKGEVIQTIKSQNSEREEYISELLSGQLISMDFYGTISLYDYEDNGLYKKKKTLKPLSSFKTLDMIEIRENIIAVQGWDITEKKSKNPIYLCDLDTEQTQLITDNSESFNIYKNSNLIIFKEKNIEIYDTKHYKTISNINIIDNIEIMSTLLYNNKTVLIANKNEEVIEYALKKNEMVEVDRIKVKCSVNYVTQILKSTNGSIVLLGDIEIYLFKPVYK